MSAGLGMDLVRIERIRRVLDDHPERFRARVFTPTECRDAADRGAGEVASLAARFAAKEAALKALGTGRSSGIGWKDVEIQRTDSGAPILLLHGAAADRARMLGLSNWRVSLTHDRETAGAVVVADSAGGSA